MRDIDRARLRARTILAAAAALVAAGACKRGGPPQAPPPAEVAVVQVEPHRVSTSFDITGEVYPYRRVEVRARIDGVIEARPFTEGTTVKPGQVLYRLDRVRPEAAYRSALARYQNAKRTLDRLEPLVHASGAGLPKRHLRRRWRWYKSSRTGFRRRSISPARCIHTGAWRCARG